MDYDRYKLFVGGIAKETSEEALKQYFSRYGAVLEAVVAKEKVTGKPRGFGFVRFANDCDVVKALRDTHFILGKPVSVTAFLCLCQLGFVYTLWIDYVCVCIRLM
jgi:RNA-binding protein Musashi